MASSIEKLLDKRIQEVLEKLETEDDIAERKILNETLDTLYRQKMAEKRQSEEVKVSKSKNDLDKEKLEFEKQKAIADADLEREKMFIERSKIANEHAKTDEMRKNRLWTTAISIASMITGVGTTYWGFKTVLKYEETGIFTSILAKDAIKNLVHFRKK